jgi:hypothetical protein
VSVYVAARALLYQRQAHAGLVGAVYRQDPDKGPVFVAQITVPIVDWSSSTTGSIDALDRAPSGRYLLQLTLPDGRVVTESFEIAPGQPTQVTIDIPHEGPAEWTSLHALKGAFSARLASPADPFAAPQPFPGRVAAAPRSYAELRADPERGLALRFLAPQAGGGDYALPQLAALIRADLAAEDAVEALGTGSEIAMPVQEEQDYALFELVHGGSLGDGASRGWFHFGPGTDVARVYLLVQSSRGASLVSLPAPWTREGEEVEIELLLDKTPRTGEPTYSLTIADPMINSALGYVSNGAVHEAARLIDFEAARDLLFHKISSPLAAAFGGYLLMLGLDRRAYTSRSDDWKGWVDNLAHWFEWLPDGAILRAALYFVLGDKDRDGAYDALMRAFDRGLPFFTFGLRLMLEGLRRFASEGDALAAERLALLEPIAQATDPSHNFLAVDIARHWQRTLATGQLEVAGG